MDKIINNEVAAPDQQQSFTASERMVLREPYAVQYRYETLPALTKDRQSADFRRLHDAPDREAKAAIARGMQKK